MPNEQWIDIGSVDELKTTPLQSVMSGTTPITLTYKNGSFAAISGVCNHAGGPLGAGTLDGDYVVCPGITGSSIINLVKGNRDTNKIGSPPMRLKSLMVVSTSISHRPQNGRSSGTSPTRLPVQWFVSLARSVSWASRRR